MFNRIIYNNQFSYDNATEPELYDYQDEPMFADFAEFVTLELLNGRDWQDLSSEVMMIDLDLVGGKYQFALEWVVDRMTEKQYLEYLEELNEN